MNVPGFSTNGLKALQDAIRKALEADKTYGVRAFPDWKEMADKLEAQLDLRRETYTKVPW